MKKKIKSNKMMRQDKGAKLKQANKILNFNSLNLQILSLNKKRFQLIILKIIKKVNRTNLILKMIL